jgi:hypothetical protein
MRTLCAWLSAISACCVMSGRASATRDGDALRVARHALREVADDPVERRGEKSSVWRSFGIFATMASISSWKPMSSMRSASSSTRLDATEVHRAPVHVVLQPSRGGDDDVHRAREQLQLQAVGHAAHHARGAHALAVAVGVAGFLDLEGEFARRREHQHARAHAADGGGLVEALQRGQQEGGGLAAARLR